MARFHYRAVDQSGRQVDGTLTAASLHDATEQLRAREIEATAIEAIDSAPRRFEPQGARPAAPPRDVEVKLRSQPGGWVLVLVGGIFTLVASLFMIVGLVLLVTGESEGLWFTLFPLIHLSVGVGLLWFGLGSWAKRRRIYRDGEVAMGTIEGVGYNRSVRVNGRSPYEIVWTFEVEGHRYHDKHSTFDDQAMELVPGDRIWVLFDPADPEQSAEWPPLG